MWQKYQYNYWYKNVRGRRKPSKKLQGREVRQREFALEPGAFHVWWEEERQKLEEEDMVMYRVRQNITNEGYKYFINSYTSNI